jgi:flavin reductase (DIM6/NTAB) family NADH-FMN oxidoreductase RutF
MGEWTASDHEEVAGAAPDALWYREVLGHYPTGVAVVTALDAEGLPVAMVVGSFVSVSLDPPLVAYFPQRSSSSYARLRDAGRYVISVLAADQEQLCRRLASRDPDKLAGLDWATTASGTPLIAGCVAWIECDLEQRHDGGDHEIVLGRIVQMATSNPRLPLLFFQGGYGRFSPLSLVVPSERTLIPSLRAVEAARSALEAIAADTGHDVLAIASIDDELVLLASAGAGDDAGTSLVGRRMPHVPPLGALFVADDDELSAAWLARSGNPADAERFGSMLDRVRARGWSMTTADPWGEEWDAALAEFSEGEYTPSAERRLHALIGQRAANYEPESGLATEAMRLLAAPIRDADGRVVLEILLMDIGADIPLTARESLLRRLTAGAADAESAVRAAV